jgi:hypothetical protein
VAGQIVHDDGIAWTGGEDLVDIGAEGGMAPSRT